MKKRMTLALAAGALMAAMLPGGVTALDEACEASDPTLAQSIDCVAATRDELRDLYKEMDRTAKELQKKLTSISRDGGAVSSADRLEIQALTNQLLALSQTGTSVVSSANTATMSMARNVKS